MAEELNLTVEQQKALAIARARLRSQQQEQKQTEAQAINPAEGMGPLQRGLVGAGGAMRRAYLGVRSLIPGQELTNQEKEELAVFDQAKNNLGLAGTVGGIGADIAMSAAPAAGVLRAANVVSRGAPLLRQALLRGGAELGFGAGYGAITAPEERQSAAAQGAVGSALGIGLNRVIGGAFRPLVTPEASSLASRGVQPTIGQSIGGNANIVEQRLMSVPIAGDIIRNARQRALGEFNEQAIKIANPSSSGFGDEALTAARESIGDMYKSALSGVPKLSINSNPIIRATINAADDPALVLSGSAQKKVYDYVQKNILDRSQNLDAEAAKRIESDFAAAIRNLRSSSTGEDRAVAEALSQIQRQWHQSLTAAVGKVNPAAAKTLREADSAWKAFLPLDRAASYAGSQRGEIPGKFTPRALRRAIEAQDRSQFNNVTRAQRAGTSQFDELNKFARQGEQVLGDNVPDSGTAGRMMLGLGGVGAGYLSGMMPELIGASALTGAAYSRAGTRALTAGIEPAYKSAVQTLSLRGVPMQSIDNLLRRFGPQAVIAASRSYALQDSSVDSEN